MDDQERGCEERTVRHTKTLGLLANVGVEPTREAASA